MNVTADTCQGFCLAIGGPNNDIAYDVIELSDGSFVIVGTTASAGQGGYDAYALRLDQTGSQILWTKTIGTAGSDFFLSVARHNGDTIIAVGKRGNNACNYQYALHYMSYASALAAVLDGASGNLINNQYDLWYQTGSYMMRSVDISFINRNRVVLGARVYNLCVNRSSFIARYDQFNTVVWAKFLNPRLFRGGIQISRDGHRVYVAGRTWDNGTLGFTDMYIAALRYQNGNFLWGKYLGGNQREELVSVTETYNHQVVACGLTQSYGASDWNFYLVALDSFGNVQWSLVLSQPPYGGYNPDAYCYDVYPTRDSGVIAVGSIERYHAGNWYFDLLLVKVDKNGNLQWAHAYGQDTLHERGHAVIELSTGGYLAVGVTQDGDPGSNTDWDIFVVRTDPAGFINCPKGCKMTTNVGQTSTGVNSTGGGSVSNTSLNHSTSNTGISVGGNRYDICQ